MRALLPASERVFGVERVAGGNRTVRRDRSLEAAAKYMALGFELAALVLGTLLVGSYLDRRFGTEPWLTILLVLGGVIGVTRRLLWLTKKNSGR